jgi:hypothetical protein
VFHIINNNSLYNILNEKKIEIGIHKGKKDYDVAQFLDDISVWMDRNREYITESYLPFSVLSVGIIPVQVSAFMYGMFVGKALEKNGIEIKIDNTTVDKETILKEIQSNIDYYNGLMGESLKDKLKEFGNDNPKETPGK